jgi:hypothetical protein
MIKLTKMLNTSALGSKRKPIHILSLTFFKERESGLREHSSKIAGAVATPLQDVVLAEPVAESDNIHAQFMLNMKSKQSTCNIYIYIYNLAAIQSMFASTPARI